MGNLNTLKDYLSAADKTNKDHIEKVASWSREVERLHNEVASLASTQKKSSGEITC